ncbi:MAG: hypothetical protein JXA20_18405 [Spirochaetes bacterium]|nr:hypothetical protein [Spirochaetota bacterium]
MEPVTEVKLFDADSFSYCGSILVYTDNRWEFAGVTNEQLLDVGRYLPLKGVLQMLMSMNMVYDIISRSCDAGGGSTDA